MISVFCVSPITKIIISLLKYVDINSDRPNNIIMK